MNATLLLKKIDHFSVMLDQILSIITPQHGGTFIDCTFGAGGYSKAILKYPNTKVIAFDRDQSVKHTASLFLSGSGEIKRVFEAYLRKWCNHKELRIKNHDKFVKETEDMFRLVLRRIEDETEHLYPLLRGININASVAA